MDISILDIIHDTMVDGPGFRTAIYCAGCPNACPGCHNPQSWDINKGHLVSTDELLKVVDSDPFADVTFSGGDPMFQAEGFTELAKKIRQVTNKTIWCWTGFTFETLVDDDVKRMLLEQIDVLVDGPFIKALKDDDLIFRGSRNQRIIDVPASLKTGRVVQIDYHPGSIDV